MKAKMHTGSQVDHAPLLDRDSLQDPLVSDNAHVVLRKRYLAKDDDGNIVEDPKGMYIRVAEAVAMAEIYPASMKEAGWANGIPESRKDSCLKYAREFYDIMSQNLFVPNSPTLMNAGRRLGMLSACFVLPVEDDLESIFDSVKATALVQRAGGGTGFDFSPLRPSGSIVKSSGGTTSGSTSFTDVFSKATDVIQQGAFRRGANMGIMRIDHPDIIKFIKAKEDLERWQNYNVSVAVTRDFMGVLETNPRSWHKVHHPEWGEGTLWVKNGEVKAFRSEGEDPDRDGWTPWTVIESWNLICERAWQTGEPGLFFIDEANDDNPVEHLGRITATNPCGEQPLHAFDSCNLGSIDVSKFIVGEGPLDEETWTSRFDHRLFEDTVRAAVRFLDNVITVNNYPIPEIEEMSKRTRRIGLGIMGFADMLFKLRVPYDSEEARDIARELGEWLYRQARAESRKLGEEKGSFGAYEGSSFEAAGAPMRNSFVTTVAPTGTISIIADCSCGIEPLFALSFTRQVMPDDSGTFTEMTEVNQCFVDALTKTSFSREEKKRILDYVRDHGSLEGIKWDEDGRYGGAKHIFEERAMLTSVFTTAHEVRPLDHVRMQGAWQEHIDTAISKTINLPNGSTPKDVSDAYWEAYWLRCVGITVYRDGCRDGQAGMKQPMTTKVVEESDGDTSHINDEAKVDIIPLDELDLLPSNRVRVSTQFGTMHIHISTHPQTGDVVEIFAHLGKAGDQALADLEGMCRVASKYLQIGGSVDELIGQWKDIGSTFVMPGKDGKIKSMPDALAIGLAKWQAGRAKNADLIELPSNKADIFESEYGTPCPQCGAKLSFQEGCKVCHSCLYSAC